MSKECLILFARYPESGYCKTRIGDSIGHNKATELYKSMLADILRTFKSTKIDIVTVLSYEKSENRGKPISDDQLPVIVQRGINIGIRMFNAFEDVFARGYTKALLTGSDIPSISKRNIIGALEKLEKNDLVIGPAEDGGYYAIALKNHNYLSAKPVFTDIQWSRSSSILEQTVKVAGKRGLCVELLEKLKDIDTIKDLKAFNDHIIGSSFVKQWLMNNPEVKYE